MKSSWCCFCYNTKFQTVHPMQCLFLIGPQAAFKCAWRIHFLACVDKGTHTLEKMCSTINSSLSSHWLCSMQSCKIQHTLCIPLSNKQYHCISLMFQCESFKAFDKDALNSNPYLKWSPMMMHQELLETIIWALNWDKAHNIYLYVPLNTINLD